MLSTGSSEAQQPKYNGFHLIPIGSVYEQREQMQFDSMQYVLRLHRWKKTLSLSAKLNKASSKKAVGSKQKTKRASSKKKASSSRKSLALPPMSTSHSVPKQYATACSVHFSSFNAALH